MTLPSITISSVTTCRFALRNAFVIARGSKTEAITVVVHVTDGQHTGRGEAVPYARFGESVEATVATLNQLAAQPLRDPAHAVASLPAGAARNALDCALWDLRAKTTGEGIASRLQMGILQPVQTFFTLSLDTPVNMAAQAQQWPGLSAFKLKLGCGDAETDLACLRSVRTARPSARLIVDANEAWHANQLEELLRGAAELGVELIEQPLP
ncbi:MAG: enolase C-terminal domain-like protein, partial [Pseudomonadota bacterium]